MVPLKRAFDLTISLLALALLSPLLALIASLVRPKLGSHVLFRQQRPGLHGEPFTIYKFRTLPSATHFSPPGPDERDHRRLISGGM